MPNNTNYIYKRSKRRRNLKYFRINLALSITNSSHDVSTNKTFSNFLENPQRTIDLPFYTNWSYYQSSWKMSYYPLVLRSIQKAKKRLNFGKLIRWGVKGAENWIIILTVQGWNWYSPELSSGYDVHTGMSNCFSSEKLKSNCNF